MITASALMLLGSAAAFGVRQFQINRRETLQRARREATKLRHAAIWEGVIEGRDA